MKKRIWEKWMVLVLALIITTGSMMLPIQKPVYAATAHMKNIPVKWDLKNNKTLTYKTNWERLGWKNEKVKMTNYKVKNASKKGYKQASFKITFTRSWIPTSEEVDMHQFFTQTGGYVYDAVVDYQTGKIPSKKKVSVKESEWKWEYETCYGETSTWNFPKSVSFTVKIIYPKAYKNLCFGVGGSTSLITTANDNKFFNGKTTFSKTSYYSKKYKNISHFIRIK